MYFDVLFVGSALREVALGVDDFGGRAGPVLDPCFGVYHDLRLNIGIAWLLELICRRRFMSLVIAMPQLSESDLVPSVRPPLPGRRWDQALSWSVWLCRFVPVAVRL